MFPSNAKLEIRYVSLLYKSCAEVIEVSNISNSALNVCLDVSETFTI